MDAPPIASEDVLERAAAWCAAGRGVALATVVETWGSSPCPAGSQLAVDESGAFVGSVSGGCVEAAVIEAARRVVRSGQPCLLAFGISDEAAWRVGLACGGRIRVYLERID
jgi:GTPase